MAFQKPPRWDPVFDFRVGMNSLNEKADGEVAPSSPYRVPPPRETPAPQTLPPPRWQLSSDHIVPFLEQLPRDVLEAMWEVAERLTPRCQENAFSLRALAHLTFVLALMSTLRVRAAAHQGNRPPPLFTSLAHDCLGSGILPHKKDAEYYIVEFIALADRDERDFFKKLKPEALRELVRNFKLPLQVYEEAPPALNSPEHLALRDQVTAHTAGFWANAGLRRLFSEFDSHVLVMWCQRFALTPQDRDAYRTIANTKLAPGTAPFSWADELLYIVREKRLAGYPALPPPTAPEPVPARSSSSSSSSGTTTRSSPAASPAKQKKK